MKGRKERIKEREWEKSALRKASMSKVFILPGTLPFIFKMSALLL